MRRVLTRIGLPFVSLIVGLLLGELALRIIGFEFHLYPTIQFGWPDPVALAEVYRTDPLLLWVPRTYQATLAAAARTHPAIVFMGDSCTEFGTYPRRTLDVLKTMAPPLANGVQLGVGGWSSEQGRNQLTRDVLPLHPKVITIYFGWNDHWIALGPTDPELTAVRPLLHLADSSRLVQLLLKVRLGTVTGPKATRPNRVPLDRYRDNLTAMVQEAHGAGIAAVLITAPSNHRVGQEPAYLAERHVRDLSEVVPLHRAYVEATRAVAGHEGATLCDAAAAFDRLPPPRDRYFQQDGIHLTDAGDAAMASLVADCIVRAALGG